jgi:hypothetical protein
VGLGEIHSRLKAKVVDFAQIDFLSAFIRAKAVSRLTHSWDVLKIGVLLELTKPDEFK